MSQLIEFEVADGISIIAEVDDNQTRQGPMSNRAQDVVEKAKISFSDALNVITPVANTIIGKISNMTEKPAEVSVEFGLKLTAEAGAVLTKAGMDAHYTVTLKWENPPHEKNQNKSII